MQNTQMSQQSQTSLNPIPEMVRETTDGVLLIFNHAGQKRAKTIVYDDRKEAKQKWLKRFDVEPNQKRILQ